MKIGVLQPAPLLVLLVLAETLLSAWKERVDGGEAA